MASIFLYTFLSEPLSDAKLIEELRKVNKDGSLVYSHLKAKNVTTGLTKRGAEVITLIPVDSKQATERDDLQKELEAGNPLKEKKFLYTGIGHNLERPQDSLTFKASATGLLLLHDNLPHLLPITTDGHIRTHVSDDKLALYLSIYPPGPEGEPVTRDQVIAALQETGVKVELNTKEIDAAINAAVKEGKVQEDILAAQGRPAKHGVDGRLEYFINTKSGPATDETGRIDFFNMSLIEPIKADQKVVRRRREEKGIHGFDIFRNTLEATDGQPVELPKIENTYVPFDNPDLVLSKIDGNVSLANNQISISKVMFIKSDLDYKTGNVNGEGSIEVFGDIRAGLKVHMGHNVTVRGCIEDAEVHADGDVNIQGGFVGEGHGVVRAGGDVKARFINHQKVFAGGKIIVVNEVLDAGLVARDEIYVGGKKISISGGHAIAGRLIEVYCLGNQYGTRTLVEVGRDVEADEHFMLQQKKLQELMRDKREIIAKIQEINFGPVSGDQKAEIKKLEAEKQELDKQVNLVEAELQEAGKSTKFISKAKIVASNIVYPGTIIVVSGKRFEVHEEIRNKSFMLNKEGQVVVV